MGLTEHQIRHRIDTGRLIVIHRGVYALGPAPLDDVGRWRAAVLVAGSDGWLSHRAGSAHWGLFRWSGFAEVSSARRIRDRDGARFHRCEIPRSERSVNLGIPVVCPSRAILDLAAHVHGRPLERALNEARVLRLPARPTLAELIERYPGRRGIRAAREALDLFDGGPTPTRSELEERFLELIDRHGLRRPLMNRLVRTGVGTFTVDCIWPSRHVVIELDGWGTHSSRRSMREDRRRDRALRIAGWQPSRVSPDDFGDEARLVSEITALLAQTTSSAIEDPAPLTGLPGA